MVGMFCKSCFGAKLVSYPVCYRALFVQVKSVRALVYFWVLSEQRVFVVFHTLFLVIYIHAAPFRFIRSWAGEETKSYVGLWSGFAGVGRGKLSWVWFMNCTMVWRSAFCYQHIISFVEHMRIPWWSVNGLSFYALSLLTSVQTADLSLSTSCTLRVSSFFSQLLSSLGL